MHIIQRGNNRCACFHAADDYLYYLEHLDRFARRFGCAVHAYVLMTNHVHLLLTPDEADSASLLMKYLGQHYVQHINQRYGRTGTLWEGRFKSCLAQSQTYVLACHRYIEMNPVRAGMVAHPGQYRWSSYAVNADGAGSAAEGVPDGRAFAIGEGGALDLRGSSGDTPGEAGGRTKWFHQACVRKVRYRVIPAGSFNRRPTLSLA